MPFVNYSQKGNIEVSTLVVQWPCWSQDLSAKASPCGHTPESPPPGGLFHIWHGTKEDT